MPLAGNHQHSHEGFQLYTSFVKFLQWFRIEKCDRRPSSPAYVRCELCSCELAGSLDGHLVCLLQ